MSYESIGSDDEMGILVVESHGGWPVRDVVELLNTFRRSYDGLLLFEVVTSARIQQAYRQRREIRPRPEPWSIIYVEESHFQLTSLLSLSDTQLLRLVREQDQLVVNRVSLSSPGVWEFLGKLFVLETIREYLKDRHTRRQDREYREAAERDRLQLENQLLQNQVIRERIDWLRRFRPTPLVGEF